MQQKSESEPAETKKDHMEKRINPSKHRYPHCVVWTPLPCISWLIPLIGHLGICTSAGIVRDFAGPYEVSEDQMAFGWPYKYWQLDIDSVGRDVYDRAVYDASEVYKGRMHNLFCDNCHSHVAMALNKMEYSGCKTWNMVRIFFLFTLHCRYVSWPRLVLTWLPFIIVVGLIVGLSVMVNHLGGQQ
ncbi:hypothetical protein BOX15_Mlig002789g1 [Macrostomum lignano]|uniref:Uncharacterized protein n=2 Tax=Macrostomum lignano TaxID=282301 RepID=A0A267F8T0_9PLAT|nr:hypothetical protein BOX15_Mlig002789g1 [Macrostomum lignano]